MEQPEQDKQYLVLSFSRGTLQSLGFSEQQLHRLTDEDLARIGASVARTYPDFLQRVKINVGLYLISLENRRAE